jgi:hypothetical protein
VVCSLGSLSYRAQLLSSTDLTWLSLSVYIFRQAPPIPVNRKPPFAIPSNPPPSAAEMSAGIICGCMPVLAPLFRDRAGKSFPFPSLRYFLSSRFSSRSSRRPFVSDDKIRLAETPPPSKRAVASEQELSGSYIELERGTNLARADRTVTDAKGGLRSDERFGV